MEHTFRSRGDVATVTVRCDNDEQHVVVIRLDGTVTNQHDADSDAVLFALGGEQHACRQVENSYVAAVTADAALRGIEDVPGVRFVSNQLRSQHHCNSCRRVLRDGTEIGASNWEHFASPMHLAAAYNAAPTLIKEFSRWIARRIPDPYRTNTSRMNAALRDRIADTSHTTGSPYHRALARGLTVTVPLLNAYVALTGDEHHAFEAVTQIRQRGARVEWLTHLAAYTTPAAIRRAIRAHDDNSAKFMNSLMLARNVPAHTIAQYLNSGITTHFHTYAHHRATKEQILAVYNASGGNRTLADYLKDGVSIPDAINDAPNHRAA